jgi:hypothetical protein
MRNYRDLKTWYKAHKLLLRLAQTWQRGVVAKRTQSLHGL